MPRELREVWRYVPGWFARYEVSNLGRVRSVTRVVKQLVSKKMISYVKHGRILSAAPDGRGYLKYGFRKDGAYYNYAAHQLVTAAFIGPMPEGMQVRHLNGNKEDNRLENLVYGTAKENSEDRERHKAERMKNAA
jgi:HNH endonuclease/NUMOD4 motif